ncbi:hypothetical protein AAFF_G00070060 [Aldrovandia affinis]|uniref:Myb-like domain-containing protein n=1 Tax=Aldrovandia affinis TaxID=143900 RepID=A0AAD7WD99_9TELE|nr:hypothetical protein AAFF_G00070060 [Aldrovandia affinis]
MEQQRRRMPRGLSGASINQLPSYSFSSNNQMSGQTQRRLREAARQFLGHHFEWHMESNYPVITNVFDTDWCNHLWRDTKQTSTRGKGVTMESQHANLHQGGSESGYVSFKNEPEHRDLLMQEVHIPSEMPILGNSSVYPLQPGGLQNSGKNAVSQRDFQGLHFHRDSDSRKSRARFTREEEMALLAVVVERWDELYGYQSQMLPRGAKSRIWSEIAARVSAISREVREGEEVRKKWLYTKLTLRNRLRAASQLGLGTYPPDLSSLEQRVLALMGHDSGGSVDAPDIGFGPVSGEDFRPLTLQGPEDLDTVGSTSDTEMDGSQDEPQEESVPPPFTTTPAVPVSVPSPVPVSTTPSTSASNSQRKNTTRPEDPLAPALAEIKTRQDRSISLYKEAITVLRSLAGDVRRYVDHMLIVTTPKPVSQGALASKRPAPPTSTTSGQTSTPQPQQPPGRTSHLQAPSPAPPQTAESSKRHTTPPATNPAPSLPQVPTTVEHPPDCQPPSAIPFMHPQPSAPPSQTVLQHPTRSLPMQYPLVCSYPFMPPFPTMAYPAYCSGPQSSMYQFPQHTLPHPATAPPIYQYPPVVTVVTPPSFCPTPTPFASHAVLHQAPTPSFYPAPPSAPVDPAQPAANCDPFYSRQAASHTVSSPPPVSSHHPYQSDTQRGRSRGWVRKRWGRRGGSWSPLGRSSLC